MVEMGFLQKATRTSRLEHDLKEEIGNTLEEYTQ